VFTTIAVPGIDNNLVFGINNKGEIVGYYFDNSSPNTNHGFVFNGGVFTTLDAPGAGNPGTYAVGINDFGQVVGYTSTSSFLATSMAAVPEPHTLPALVGCLISLFAMASRRSTDDGCSINRC
jgi:uncharacterized membrane protein